MIELTPEQQAELGRIDAQAEIHLSRLIDRYRAMSDTHGVFAIEAMEANLMGPSWSMEALATLATYALRRLAR